MGWDRGLEYESTLSFLREAMNSKSPIARCYARILALQLLNGSRISEAIRASYLFSQNNLDKVEVPLSKVKSDTRMFVKPEWLDFQECRALLEVLVQNIRKAVVRVSSYAIRYFNMNTHSLRYSFITQMSTKGYQPQIIARMTGHKKIDYIITYTQRKTAREILERTVRGGEVNFGA